MSKMAEAAKDPAIKLFGKTIPLQEIPADNCCCDKPTDEFVNDMVDDDVNDDDGGGDDDDDSRVINHELPSSSNTDDVAEDRASQERATDKVDQDGMTSQTKQVEVSSEVSDKSNCQDTSGKTDNPEASSGGDEKAAGESSKSEEEKAESASQEKTPKKPDKILPCPRCNSMDTKFCYYNNYNVNQPRHFCKNCQRYWTAGGTMRNVPVGAGRRKNKNSASQYRHVTIPEPIHNTRPDMPNGVHPALPTNGAVLTFSSDAPLCESMASILNLAEKTARNGPPNGFQKPEELKISIPFVGGLDSSGNHHVDGSNAKDDSSRSAIQEQPAPQNCLPYPPQIPCYPGGPWPYPWNSTQWSPPVAAPPFCPNGFAMPFYPAPAYWGCTVPGTWNIPWIAQPSPPSHSNPSSAPNSPLGKHSREGNMLSSTSSEEKELEENSSERSLWIPKTLRIDDPGEAAKSSIWTTLGIKNNDKSDSISRGSGLFKAFQSKRDEGNPHMDTSSVLEANPAALSRSQNFHENS